MNNQSDLQCRGPRVFHEWFSENKFEGGGIILKAHISKGDYEPNCNFQ